MCTVASAAAATLAVGELRARLDSHNEKRKEVQSKMEAICAAMREEIAAMEDSFNDHLHLAFDAEDTRLQSIVHALNCEMSRETCTNESLKELVDMANAALLIVQNYSIVEKKEDQKGLCKAYELKTERSLDWKYMDLKCKKPGGVTRVDVLNGRVSIDFASPFTELERKALEETSTADIINFRVMIDETNSAEPSDSDVMIRGIEDEFVFPGLKAETDYFIKMRAEHDNEASLWSSPTKFTSPTFKDSCVWNKCPDPETAEYEVDETDPCIASFHGNEWAVITGSAAFPSNKVTAFSVKVLKSEEDDCDRIYVGIVPFWMAQHFTSDWKNNGWYFYCFTSSLWSGLPHKYRNSLYGPRREDGKYVTTGDTIGVVMDMEKGSLSFSLNGIDLGVAYEGIPLDKPLVPCVILWCYGDSIQLIK